MLLLDSCLIQSIFYSHFITKLHKLGSSHGFGGDIYKLIVSFHKFDEDLAIIDAISNEMVACVDVPSLVMMN